MIVETLIPYGPIVTGDIAGVRSSLPPKKTTKDRKLLKTKVLSRNPTPLVILSIPRAILNSKHILRFTATAQDSRFRPHQAFLIPPSYSVTVPDITTTPSNNIKGSDHLRPLLPATTTPLNPGGSLEAPLLTPSYTVATPRVDTTLLDVNTRAEEFPLALIKLNKPPRDLHISSTTDPRSPSTDHQISSTPSEQVPLDLSIPPPDFDIALLWNEVRATKAQQSYLEHSTMVPSATESHSLATQYFKQYSVVLDDQSIPDKDHQNFTGILRGRLDFRKKMLLAKIRAVDLGDLSNVLNVALKIKENFYRDLLEKEPQLLRRLLTGYGLDYQAIVFTFTFFENPRDYKDAIMCDHPQTQNQGSATLASGSMTIDGLVHSVYLGQLKLDTKKVWAESLNHRDVGPHLDATILFIVSGEFSGEALNEWAFHAHKSLEQQLSIQRLFSEIKGQADKGKEKRDKALQTIRCYGYIIGKATLDIFSMTPKPAGFDSGAASSGKDKTRTPPSSIPGHALGAYDPNASSNQFLVKTIRHVDLHKTDDILQFYQTHKLAMKWAKQYCEAYAQGLYYLFRSNIARERFQPLARS